MKKRILVIGDVMLDRYVEGSCDRISPEAPVPILKANTEELILGGAANVALNVKNLGIETALFGVIGQDTYGQNIRDLLRTTGIKDYTLACHSTTVKTRIISKSQQLLRIDNEEQYSGNQEYIAQIKKVVMEYNPTIIIISDYAKGVVSKELMMVVTDREYNPDGLVLVDPKDNNWSKYDGTYLIKPNLKELEDVSGRKIDSLNIKNVLKEQYQKSNIENILVTLSGKGMILCTREQIVEFTTEKVDVYDVTGAGDTAIAVIAYGIHEGMTITDTIKLATKASTHVVTKNKTYAISKAELEKLK